MTTVTSMNEQRGETTFPADVIEQVMRMTDDEVNIVGFLDFYREDRKRVLGHFLRTINESTLPAGTPLHAWVYRTPVVDQWRDTLSAVPGSLWEQYRDLVAFVGEARHVRNPYDALRQLLRQADARVQDLTPRTFD